MQWLFPSIVATLIGTLLLSGVYLYLYRAYRYAYLLIWLWAWVLYSLRFVFELIGVSYPSILITITTHSVTLISGILLFWGTCRFSNRPFSRLWTIVGLLGVAWITVSAVAGASFLLITTPSFTLLSVLFIWTGLVIIRSETGSRASRLITGLCFILWGIHKADYPFLRTVEWFAPWGFLLSAVFEIAVALGMLLIFFEALQAELAAKERVQRTILEAARNVSFIVADAESRDPIIQEFSPGAEQIFGYTREEMLGQHISILHLPEDVAQFPEAQRKMKEGKTGFGGEIMLVRKNGEVFPAMFTTYPMFNEEGTLEAAVGVSIDITRSKQDEEKLKALLDEKNILLAEVHHRVKNNLQIVISLLGLQASEIGDEQLAIALSESRNRVSSMALVHELLYHSNDYTHIDVGEYIDQLATTLFSINKIEPEKIDIEIETAQIYLDLEKAIPCGLLLNELITNSLKYAFPDGRKGKIWIKFILENENMTLFYGDDGIGIPDSFDLATSQSLGLQLVNLLATHDLQGKIGLEYGQGTRFRIEFPVAVV